MPTGPVGRYSGRGSPGDQLRCTFGPRISIGLSSVGSIPELGQPIHLRANGEEGALDPGTPGFERLRCGLEGGDPLVALVLDLDVAHHLQIVDALLQLADALGEVATLVVGNDGGSVLGGGELLQGVKAAVKRRSKRAPRPSNSERKVSKR